MATDTTPATTAADAAAITAALGRLSDHAISEPELGPVVTVLDALTDNRGPLLALAELLSRTADALTDYEDEDIDRAADRTADASRSVTDAIADLRTALRLLRPLEG